MAFTRERLLKKSERVVKEFQFPDDFPQGFAGEKFYVLRQTAKERAQFEKAMKNSKGVFIAARHQEFRERLVTVTFCDPDGTLLLGPNDVDALKEQDNVIIEYVAAAAVTVNKISDADIEELAKN